MTQRYLVLDYETRSEADLKKVGAFEYAAHPSTKILCAAWRSGTRADLKKEIDEKIPPKVWSPAFEKYVPVELSDLMNDHTVKIIAHNAFFEQVITRFVFIKYFQKETLNSFIRFPSPIAWIYILHPDRFICTASMAAALALPRNLEGACLALKLPIQKDMIGRKLMLKLSKPRKATKNNSAKFHNSITDLKRIMEYCQKDVDAETLLFLSIPELSRKEREVWLLDQKINFRGFEVDRELVLKVLDMIETETLKLNLDANALTRNLIYSATQRDLVLEFIQSEGFFLPDLRAKTVADAIKTGLVQGDAKELLEIRQAISKTSTAKYEAFELRSRYDGRIRDFLVYHTASTGRWGGSGVQPQNFPRGSISDTTTAAEILKSEDLDIVRLIYGRPMDAFSSCLRGCITAPIGKRLICADYAAIEARVLFWVARHDDGLKAFRENRPLYEEMAQVIYNIKDITKVTKAQRQVGKQSVLGCGYGMGSKKFLATCRNFGIEVDEDVADVAVKAYRSTHNPVVKLWSNLEKAAIAATLSPGKKYKVNYTAWWVQKGFLWCELPSGRRLAYYGAEVRFERTPWDEKRAVLYHYGVNPLTRKWEQSGTYGGRLCENVIQAVARDIMAEAMLRIEKSGYDIILSVHDELLAEKKLNEGSVKEFEDLMAETPDWALGCPIKVEGWEGPRYRK